MPANMTGPRKCGGAQTRQSVSGVEKLTPDEEEARAEMVAYRTFLDWTQHRVAYELGVDRKTVGRWETSDPARHQRVPSAATKRLRRLAIAAGYDERDSLREAV